MGWSFRKAVNMGGLRLNFSKSGIGASAGVRGFRYGINPYGRHYIRCGYGGIYYTQNLGTPIGSGRRASSSSPSSRHQSWSQNNATGIGPAQPIGSAAVEGIVDSTSVNFVNEIQKRLRTPHWHLWFLGLGAATAIAGIGQQLNFVTVLGILVILVGGTAGYLVYRRHRTTAVQYHLDAHFADRYSRFLKGCEQLRTAQRLWRVDAIAAVSDSKYHAGATSWLSRKPVSVRLGAPSFLDVNLKPPSLRFGGRAIYFLPDLVLVVDGSNVGAVSYSHLSFATNPTTFIEAGYRPSDSEQVGTTWRFVNKSGGPDRRFANNRQIPILQYAELCFHSDSGLNETIQVSNVQSADAFAQGLSVMLQPQPQPQPQPAPTAQGLPEWLIQAKQLRERSDAPETR